MAIEDTPNRVLEYLKKGPTNTYKLASELGIDRHKILSILKELGKKQLIEFKSGIVRFLKSPVKEKKVLKKLVEVKKAYSKPKKEVEYKTKKTLQKLLLKSIANRKLSIVKDIQAENKEFKERLLALEASIKRQSSIKNKLREQNEHIEKLEKAIVVLQQKASAPPKIIRRTIVKNIIKEVPVEKVEAKPKKFKVLKFDISWMKNIQRLAKPQFLKQKINIDVPKISFADLNKDIQQLHVPEILR